MSTENEYDAVDRPIHYSTHASGVECIEIAGQMNFCLGNAFKYLWRYNLKAGVEDLKKAAWYIKRAFQDPKYMPVAREIDSTPYTKWKDTPDDTPVELKTIALLVWSAHCSTNPEDNNILGVALQQLYTCIDYEEAKLKSLESIVK